MINTNEFNFQHILDHDCYMTTMEDGSKTITDNDSYLIKLDKRDKFLKYVEYFPNTRIPSMIVDKDKYLTLSEYKSRDSLTSDIYRFITIKDNGENYKLFYYDVSYSSGEESYMYDVVLSYALDKDSKSKKMHDKIDLGDFCKLMDGSLSSISNNVSTDNDSSDVVTIKSLTTYDKKETLEKVHFLAIWDNVYEMMDIVNKRKLEWSNKIVNSYMNSVDERK